MLFSLTSRTRYLIAGLSHVSGTLLDELAQSPDQRVRARVAEHPNTPIYTLFRLIKDDNPEVRQSISFNPNRTVGLLLLLAEDSNPDVRYSIAEDAKVSPAILHFLSADDNPYVAQRALKTLSRLETLDLAAQSPRHVLPFTENSNIHKQPNHSKSVQAFTTA